MNVYCRFERKSREWLPERPSADDAQFCPNCNVRRKFKEVRAVGLLFHDLRRSAARNARASGVPEGIVMKLGGWRTREVFDRYAIIEESDMEQAIDLIEARRLLVATRGANTPVAT